jgi:hypothetical protein
VNVQQPLARGVAAISHGRKSVPLVCPAPNGRIIRAPRNFSYAAVDTANGLVYYLTNTPGHRSESEAAMRASGSITAGLMLLLAAAASAGDSRDLTAKIDHHIEAAWKANGAMPAARADDAEFLRRIYLDLAGRIPTVYELRRFLDDKSSDKRAKEIDKLLDGPGFVQHFATIYRREWLPQTLTNPQLQFFGMQFEIFMRKQLKSGRRYDQIVRDLVTVPPTGLMTGNEPGAAGAIAFLAVNELKPENIASATARLFLGVKVECAQCHDHPFDAYTREQFWEFTAFFAGLQPTSLRGNRAPSEALEIRSVMIPGTEKKVSAKFLTGGAPQFREKVSPRVTLMDWMTAKDNPYFARNAVNRMWAQFFGVGIVDPLDEPGDKNPPSHPKLLDDLARDFAESSYDIKYLIRAIVNSRAYQLSSSASGASDHEERTFARMKVRGLTPEQLFDSLVIATGYREHSAGEGSVAPNSARGEFLARFATTERLSEVQTSILQALTLMNGKFIGEMTNVERSETLTAVMKSPFMDTAQQVETLYLAAISRRPRAEELKKLVAYVDRGGPSGDRDKALADVFWALLNSSEFGFNH